MGYHFDCASSWEIDLVLGLGGKAENIIFANPCKAPSHVIHARNVGVKMLVIDSSEEAENIKEVFPEA